MICFRNVFFYLVLKKRIINGYLSDKIFSL